MGKYYGLYNHTKYHKVSSYWKTTPPTLDEIKEIAVDLNWNINSDKISTYSYEDAFELVNDNWVEVKDEDADPSDHSVTTEQAIQEQRVEDAKYVKFGIKYQEQPDGSMKRLFGREYFDSSFFCC
jgi:hypothetical protein